MWLMGLLIQVGEEGAGASLGAGGAEGQRVSVETIARVGETAAMLGGRVYDDDDVQKAVTELVQLCRELTAARTLEAGSIDPEGRRAWEGVGGETGKGGVGAAVGLELTGCLYAGPGLAPAGIDGLGLEERLTIGAVAGRLAS